jgi:hypothetical protein
MAHTEEMRPTDPRWPDFLPHAVLRKVATTPFQWHYERDRDAECRNRRLAAELAELERMWGV